MQSPPTLPPEYIHSLLPTAPRLYTHFFHLYLITPLYSRFTPSSPSAILYEGGASDYQSSSRASSRGRRGSLGRSQTVAFQPGSNFSPISQTSYAGVVPTLSNPAAGLSTQRGREHIPRELQEWIGRSSLDATVPPSTPTDLCPRRRRALPPYVSSSYIPLFPLFSPMTSHLIAPSGTWVVTKMPIRRMPCNCCSVLQLSLEISTIYIHETKDLVHASTTANEFTDNAQILFSLQHGKHGVETLQ